MEKKYTMKEFKEMFEEAQFKALENIEEKFKEADKENQKKGEEPRDAMFFFVNSMQNMIAYAELKKVLFGEE